MGNVINFAAVVNARRVAAAQAERAEAIKRSEDAERAEIARTLGGTLGAHIIADVVTEMRAQERKDRYVPAYCDPANEVRGAKYDATRDLRPAELAARIRADIKAAKLPAGVKVSVRLHTYSGGYSIDVKITALPEGFPVMSPKAASWRKQFGPHKDYPFYWCEATSDELRALIDQLKSIHDSYNRDNSDSMTDYFDTRFYGDVHLDCQLQRERIAAEVAASPGTYWHDDN